MNVTIRYPLKEAEEGFVAERMGEPEVVPRRRAAGEGKRRGGRRTVLRGILKKRLDRDSPYEVALDQFSLPVSNDRTGESTVERLSKDAGCLFCSLTNVGPSELPCFPDRPCPTLYVIERPTCDEG
jgi:hypothetical protein